MPSDNQKPLSNTTPKPMADLDRQTAAVGDIVIVLRRGKPGYRAKVESSEWRRLTVRPLPDQGETTRARTLWDRAIFRVEDYPNV
jgi:hypothetical protein